MGLHEKLLDLDSSVRVLSQGVNALGLMADGLDQVMDPYADGFHALYACLEDADRKVRERVRDCLETI